MDIVARDGGDEFTVILPDTDLEGGTVFAERFRERAAKTDFTEVGDPLHATISIGVATINGSEEISTEAMIERSDAALYRAKQAGRNKVHQGDAAARGARPFMRVTLGFARATGVHW